MLQAEQYTLVETLVRPNEVSFRVSVNVTSSPKMEESLLILSITCKSSLSDSSFEIAQKIKQNNMEFLGYLHNPVQNISLYKIIIQLAVKM